jgi:hypothetical protein
MAIKIPISIVINGTTSAAHQKSTERKNNQQLQGRHTLIGEP